MHRRVRYVVYIILVLLVHFVTLVMINIWANSRRFWSLTHNHRIETIAAMNPQPFLLDPYNSQGGSDYKLFRAVVRQVQHMYRGTEIWRRASCYMYLTRLCCK